MEGSPRFSVNADQFKHLLWVSLLFGLSAGLTKLAADAALIDWGPYSQIVTAVICPAILWFVKMYLTDSESYTAKLKRERAAQRMLPPPQPPKKPFFTDRENPNP